MPAITTIATYAYHISARAQFGTKNPVPHEKNRADGGQCTYRETVVCPLFSVEQVQKNTYTAKEILVLLTKKIQ